MSNLPDNALLLISIGGVLWALLEFSWRGCRAAIRWYQTRKSNPRYSNEQPTDGHHATTHKSSGLQTSGIEQPSNNLNDSREILSDSATNMTSTLPPTLTEVYKSKSMSISETVTGHN